MTYFVCSWADYFSYTGQTQNFSKLVKQYVDSYKIKLATETI